MSKDNHPQEELYNAVSRILTEKGYGKPKTKPDRVSDTLEYELWVNAQNQGRYILLELQLGESREILSVRIFREITPSMGANYNPIEMLLELLDSE